MPKSFSINNFKLKQTEHKYYTCRVSPIKK